MEGVVALLICAVTATGCLIAASGMNKARRQAQGRRVKAGLLAGVVCFSIAGGFAVVTGLVLVAAWIVLTWW